ncbi:hypothetical protein DAEQUDRAFT_78100 [Daedalea quercina L-15889]|uniref:DUF7729 domain-containing protein n=1 Tax=Daedalea quercina L-15889 TaxID=1314783 RepID=A0A165SFU4_9APHY|nr:hypothetical protein DAEQUDRAFT_78100 [Daedalea quercina L-15889]
MFTPPPSPDPPRTHCGRHELRHSSPLDVSGESLTIARSSSPASSSRSSSPLSTPLSSCLSTPEKPHLDDAHIRALMKKRRNARRLKFSVLVVPIALIVITLSTRYMSHPAILDVLSADEAAHGWQALAASVLDWQGNVHEAHDKREVEYELELEVRSPQTASAISFPSQSGVSTSTASAVNTATSLVTASATTTSTAPTASAAGGDSSTVPTIPSEPPVLPTPFPQPFDSTGITTNFSTDGCRDFFLNMTQTAPFRDCRPFSMLLANSDAFFEAQSNLTELNTVVWGTCNTDLNDDECEANMAWFADELQETCATDLKANNEVAASSLLSLQTYSIMRQAACLSSSANVYCYVSAISEAHSADAYYYELPLGTALSNASEPSCSSCIQDIMGEFVSQGLNTSGLKSTYESAAVLTNKVCGSEFVQEVETKSSGAAGQGRWCAGAGRWVAVGVCAAVSVILGLGVFRGHSLSVGSVGPFVGWHLGYEDLHVLSIRMLCCVTSMHSHCCAEAHCFPDWAIRRGHSSLLQPLSCSFLVA